MLFVDLMLCLFGWRKKEGIDVEKHKNPEEGGRRETMVGKKRRQRIEGV